MKALASFGVCLIAALAAGCTFDASQLRPLPDAGASGAGGTASPPDAPIATGGNGDTAASSPDAPGATGGSGGSAAIGGSGGRGEIGASDASAAAGGVDARDARDAPVATGGTSGAGSVGVGAGGSSYIGASGITTSPFGGSGGAGGSGGSSGGVGGTVASGGVVATGGSGGAAGGIGGGGAAGGNTTVPTGGTGTSTTISTGTMHGPSCTGLPETCGPFGNESCCTSLLVPGGTFNRSNDTNYPAKVSDFYLDKYEITVGRFRQFVNAGMGTQANPPAPGSGAHPLIVGSGWDSTWNAELPADAASLKAAMKCNSADQTWTDTAEGNESQPQNCMTWFEAAAFCAWDGGRLPTEAEWNYAAAGGTEQRAYPWSSPPTSTTIDDSYAVYCGGSCNNAQNVGSKSPEGDGKWGQADLAGNVWEWALDYWSDPYLMPCDNCASLSTASARVIRGGYFGYPAYILATSFRYNVSPDYPGGGVGSRCARIGSIEGGGDAGVPDAPVAQPDVSVGGSGGSGGFGGGVATGGSGGAAGGIGGGGAAGGNTTVPTGGTGTSTTISTGTMQGPSCTGLTKTCGPSGNESCCASILVPSGTFYRGYDGVAFTDKGYPATVSDFYLDKYEITVGRFRAFVNAGVGTQANPPAAGAGAHPLIADSGWDSTWNTNLPADTASLKAAMKCDSTFQTWTDTTGGNENRPQNCMTWFEAAAFCAWDGGRLPTEAEWNYAATGGDEQLEYPWGNSIDPNDASYRVDYTQNCVGDGVPTCTLADLIVVGTKPAGNGRWGHADLAGNVWEWTLDWYGNFPMPCNNCANLVSSPSRVVRGGGFENIPYYVLANVRITIPTSDYSDIGSRCARIGSIGGGGDAGRPDAPGAQPDVSVGGSGGSGGSSGGGGGTVASGGVVATGGIVGTGGNTAVCQESATLCSDDGLQTCANGQWGAGVPCSAGLVCERYPQAACFDPTWAEWPMPNSQVDVTAGAPNLESYTDNKDGTITDNVTGLMWQQVVSTTTYTWAQAVAYCPKLTLAGHSDWRLPSRIELVSIVDLGVTSGVPINATYFPSTPVGWFWSSSPWAGSPRYAWGVGFGDVGYTNFSDVPYMTNARCVR